MTARRITIVALLTSAAVLGIAEINALANNSDGDTISEQIADIGKSQPIAMIAVGAVAVHFAGGIPKLQQVASKNPLVALGIGAIAGAAWPLKGIKNENRSYSRG